jgi:hypothetical protein
MLLLRYVIANATGLDSPAYAYAPVIRTANVMSIDRLQDYALE